jgi:hypothetical protein
MDVIPLGPGFAAELRGVTESMRPPARQVAE